MNVQRVNLIIIQWQDIYEGACYTGDKYHNIVETGNVVVNITLYSIAKYNNPLYY